MKASESIFLCIAYFLLGGVAGGLMVMGMLS